MVIMTCDNTTKKVHVSKHGPLYPCVLKKMVHAWIEHLLKSWPLGHSPFGKRIF